MNRIVYMLLAALAAGAIASTALLAETFSGLRGPVPLDQIAPAPRMTPLDNTAEKRVRNYPEQPPVIPHQTRDYQITLNANKCLTCHSRQFTEQSQAPMISITHFMDRDGQILASVTPRRYFCTACHVSQSDAPPLVENTFRDIDAVIGAEQGEGSQ